MGSPLEALPMRLVVSCEHGGNRVPRAYEDLYAGAAPILDSHRGWDPGALGLARAIASKLGAPLRYSLTTRLLVDPNRSEGSDALFSEFTVDLPRPTQEQIVRRHHRRPRARVRALVEMESRAGPVVHLGVHTFSPVWDGTPRSVDVGVLFDPERAREAALGRLWMRHLAAALPQLRVRENEPYRGAEDGLTTAFRKEFPAGTYLGIELEVRQDLASAPGKQRRGLHRSITDSLEQALRQCGSRTAPRG